MPFDATVSSKNPSFIATTQEKNPLAMQTVQVDWQRPELEDMLPQYELIDDCIRGSMHVKSCGVKYLPKPDPDDSSNENALRYDDYKKRAVFYNVSAHTLAAFVGAVFDVDPIIKVPNTLEAVVKDADGSGVSLVQLAQRAESVVLAKGRGGLRIDFPKVDRVTTRQDQLDGKVRPTIHFYHPGDIINWRTKQISGKSILSLIVLREQYERYDDGFALEKSPQYRVMRLGSDGLYVQEIWRGLDGVFTLDPEHTTMPVDDKGARLTELPFTFIGAVDNSPAVGTAPFFDMCDLNIAHYRNSADYEESLYTTGQSTPVVTGLTTQWYKEVLKETIRFGSRGGIPLPEGATASLLQMEERTAAFAGMEHKEKQMKALGAKLVEDKSVQRTATESSQDDASEKSVLKTVTDNVSAAFRFALEWASIFQGQRTIASDAKTGDKDKAALLFELNTDFDIATVSTEDAKTSIDAWQKGTITFVEMRTKLKQAKYAYEDDAKAQAAIIAEQMAMGEREIEHDKALQENAPVVE